MDSTAVARGAAVTTSRPLHLFDRDRKFGREVRTFLKASGIKTVRTSVRSPWQGGVAERSVGSIRREMLDHVIPLNERHLLRLGQDCIRFYHEDRTHIGLKEGDAGSASGRIAAVFVEPRAGLAADRRAASPIHLVNSSVTNGGRRVARCSSSATREFCAPGIRRTINSCIGRIFRPLSTPPLGPCDRRDRKAGLHRRSFDDPHRISRFVTYLAVQ